MTRFLIKFSENNDVGKILTGGEVASKLFRTESVVMTLKIRCTYAHYVTLGSRCKMASSSHRETDLQTIPVRISKDEAPTQLSVVGAFVYFLLVISSFSNRVRCVAFRSFSCCLLWLSQQGAYLLLGVLFYFPNLSVFVSSYVKMRKFCSSSID